jgi:MYXO-CTERM domain-containing protein
VCAAGQPLACNSGNPCVADSCDPVKGCVATPVADGTSCSDGDACNGAETCKAGACAAGKPLTCPGQGKCLAGACDPKAGCVLTALKDGTPCPDDDLCNGTETCQAGACWGGAALSCDDGDPCTVDSCFAATGCKSTPDADAGACQPDGGAGGQGGSTGQGGFGGQGGSTGQGGFGGVGGSTGPGGHGGSGGATGQGGSAGHGGSAQGGQAQGGSAQGGQGPGGGAQGGQGQGGSSGTTTTTTGTGTTTAGAGGRGGSTGGLGTPANGDAEGVTASGGCSCRVADDGAGDRGAVALAALALAGVVARRRRGSRGR